MLKQKICNYIDEIKDILVDVSLQIHSRPELNFEEYFASKLLSDKLQEAEFDVELGVAGLETAIRAVHPDYSKGPTIGILAEYDALPDIGHACGHNLIATAALGASLALGKYKKDIPGKIIFFGTPAEEGGGGKIIMIEAGLFKEIDAAMMFHPASIYTLVGRGGLALSEVKIEFFGKSAHASSTPELGINALDAVIQTFNSINALRQHITSDARIHGIIIDGGVKPNIVPDYAAASFYIRALDTAYQQKLVKKVKACAQGAALSTGAKLKFEIIGPTYASRKINHTMAAAFIKNLEILGESLNPEPPGSGLGSSDIGNVSQVVPTIHPYIAIADKEIAAHSKEFTVASGSEKGQKAMLTAAKALAMTALDVLTKKELLKNIKEEFEKK